MTDTNNFQRRGAISNSHAGREFEEAARLFFMSTGISLTPAFAVEIGGRIKKRHNFDLGSEDPPILVECKSYTWTETDRSPSAKIRGMNEVMLLFSIAPAHYRKILFVLKHLRRKTGMSLATHFIRGQGHLIPEEVEIWEFDLEAKSAAQVFPEPRQ
jgi:hypothetical protein